MKHKESEVKVFQTTDYKLFKKIDGNRSLNNKKIDRIIKEIKAGNDVLDQVPILVASENGHLNVLDGQHRLAIAEQLKRPVHYIIRKKDMSMHDVAKVNSNVEKWSFADFINAYKKSNKNYQQLHEFHKAYGFAIGSCLILLTFGAEKNADGSHEELNAKFQHGQFEVKKYKEAVQVAEICKTFSDFSGWNSRGFLIAICKLIQGEKCDFDVLLKKFKNNPKKLQQQANWKQYLTNLEEIYNIDNSKRRTIF